MLLTIEQLLNEIKKENIKEYTHDNIELKRGWHISYGDKISGLANIIKLEVSWMIIGVCDNGKLAGYNEEWAKKTEESISQQINSNLDPIQASIGIKPFEIDNSWIIVLKIKNPGAVVYWQGNAYKKAGTTIAIMTPEEAMKLRMKLPGTTDYSKQKWKGEVDINLVNSFIKRYKEHRGTLLLDQLSGDYPGLFSSLQIHETNTEKILFGGNKYRITFFDNQGNPIINDTRCSVYSIISNGLIEEIQNWSKKYTGELDLPFPPKALKEGLANCVAHAAYFENDGDIIIEVYPDKVVISNLCLPESVYFANKWFSRNHHTVNGLLMESLRLLKIVDELGRGKNLIFSESIKSGKKPPIVNIDRVGRYNRWSLHIYGGLKDEVQLRLLRRIRDTYKDDEKKALIAYALILWRDNSVKTIKQYVDKESLLIFAEVLNDIDGPIFYYEKDDKIVLNRWVRILLEEGKDSKTFTMAEEDNLYKFAYDFQNKYYSGTITPKELRKLAHIGETNSEKTLSYGIVKKWISEGKLEKIKQGQFKFIHKDFALKKLKDLFSLLEDNPL